MSFYQFFFFTNLLESWLTSISSNKRMEQFNIFCLYKGVVDF